MIILNKLKKTHLNRPFGNFFLSFPFDYSSKSREKKYFLLNFGLYKPFTTFHRNVQHNKNYNLYPKKMFSFFKKKLDQTALSTTLNFSSFKTQNYSICFHEIIIADTFSRKKIRTNMEMPGLEKITCSYTGKMLVSSSTELSIPLCALTFLTAQNCTIVWARKSVSSWKLRKNSVIGCKVTLRRKAALVFLDKFYVYGREGLLDKEQNFLNSFPFYFGVSKNKNFIELQKLDRLASNFSGFSVSIH